MTPLTTFDFHSVVSARKIPVTTPTPSLLLVKPDLNPATSRQSSGDEAVRRTCQLLNHQSLPQKVLQDSKELGQVGETFHSLKLLDMVLRRKKSRGQKETLYSKRRMLKISSRSLTILWRNTSVQRRGCHWGIALVSKQLKISHLDSKLIVKLGLVSKQQKWRLVC